MIPVRGFLLLFVPLVVSVASVGCATVHYVPYTKEVFIPKSPSYAPLVFPEQLTHRQYRMIGKLDIVGYASYAYTTSQEDVIKQFLDAAKKRGADGIANLTINQTPYQAAMYIPGYTTYQPVTTYNQGTSTATAYGSGGGFAQGFGTYHGTSTTYLPVNQPGQTIPYTGVVNSMAGDLIVLLDKDTFGYLGIWYDPYAKNISGVLIHAIQSGSAAEQAGLAVGDIVTEVGGVKVSSLEEIYAKTGPRVGEPIKIEFVRNGKPSSVTVIPQRGKYD